MTVIDEVSHERMLRVQVSTRMSIELRYFIASLGDQLGDNTRTVDTKSLLDSVIERYKSIIINSSSPIYNRFNQNWRIEPEMRHYWAASFLLPVGSIFILTVVVLLMVFFKRCPHTVAAIVTAILTIIVILITILSFNHEPVYT